MKAFLAESLGKSQSKRLTETLCLIALALITVFVFKPVLSAGFLNYDDNVMVSENLKITSFSLPHIKSILFDSHFRLYHPLVNLSFAAEYMIFGQDPYIYHADNLILHLLNSILAFFIFFTLTKKNFPAAFITAAVFACHPLSVEPVAWISSRKDVLYAFFFLSSFYAYLKYSLSSGASNSSGRRLYYVLSLAFFLLSCLSKPMAVTLPAFLILADWFLGNKINLKSFAKYVPYLAAGAFFAAATYLAYYDAGEKSLISARLLFQNLISAHFNVVFYLAKFVYPSKLAVIYPDFAGDFPLFVKLAPAFVWLLAAGAIFSLRYTKKIFFGGLFFVFAVIPVINILPAGSVSVADRYVYIAGLGLAFITACAILSVFKKLNGFRRLKTVFAVVLCAVFAAMCFNANACAKKWENSFSLFDNQIKKYPQSSAMAYVLRYEETLDIKDLREAYRINPSVSTVLVCMGREFSKKGKYDQALDFYKRVPQNGPNITAAYIGSMEIYKKLGDEEKLLKTFEECSGSLPKDRLFAVYAYMAAYYYDKNEYEKALENAACAKQIFSKEPKIYLLKAAIYEKQNDFAAAFKECLEALENYGPAYEILETLGALYFKTGNYAAAGKIFERAVKVNPSAFAAYDFLGNIAAIAGAYKNALEKYTAALLIKNNFGQAYFHRAALYMNMKKYDKAEAEAVKAKEAGFEVPASFYDDLRLEKATFGG